MIKRTLPTVASVSLLALLSGLQTGAWAQDGGFSITMGDEFVAGDADLAFTAQRQTAGLPADVFVTVDGLGVRPRLDLEVVETSPTHALLRSRINYPAWVVRGEVRLFAADGALLSVTPLATNGEVVLALPPQDPGADGVGNSAATGDQAGGDTVGRQIRSGQLTARYRVYDAAGRYDETEAVALDRVRAAAVEPGIDSTARRQIPVRGGAVTVSGTGLGAGNSVQTLGETFQTDASGGFAMQRILPVGDRAIPVMVAGHVVTQPLITIPKTEWFTVATADLTFGKTLSGPEKGATYTLGRLAYYTNGRTANGWEITSSADTGETALRDLFRDFDRKDPLGVLSRLDPDMAYPVYGDDSTLEIDAPTDGKFYFKAERDGSHLMWGNFNSALVGAEYLRNERRLYGFQGVYTFPQQTKDGEPRLAATVYAAQPDTLPEREVFLGTGGSVYFLRRQDIGIGSETLTIEVRDPVTGRVISQQRLVAGRDYQINYIQGVITLSAPLSGSAGNGTVIPEAGSSAQARLVAQYDYTPTAGEVDGYAYGGRAEAWVTDSLRLGVTGMVEKTDLADQTGTGVDLHYSFGKASHIDAEFARTDGPGFGSSYSVDGGLIVSSNDTASGSGQGYRVETALDLADLGLAATGTITGYSEQRSAGFSTLDYQTTADEAFWGIGLDIQASQKLSYRLAYDAFRSDAGRKDNSGSAEIAYQQSSRLTWDLGLTSETRTEPGLADKTGSRTDLALKATVQESDAFSWNVFGQTTLQRSGGRERNDRLGAGAKLAFGNGWSLEGTLSGGSAGLGAKALAQYENEGNSAYVGYELDPGREVDGFTLAGRDGGRLVSGGKRRLSDAVDIYGENSYDMFGQHRSLLSSYGVEYKTDKFLTLSGGLELGQIMDPGGDFDRKALSFGLQYQNDSGLSGKAKLELRRDRGLYSGVSQDADAVVLAGTVAYEVSDDKRWLMSFDMATASGTGSSVLNGDYAKMVLGYGFRPVDNDRLNLLARYTYLYDMYGQRLDGLDDTGPRQRSHVVSIDATYDLGTAWQIGGKLGYRLSQSAPDATTALAQNNAGLLVLNARFHLNRKWDALLEGRYLMAEQAGLSNAGAVATLYRQFGPQMMLGVGYDFGSVSDDLTDLTDSRQGVFVNLIAKF